MKHIFEEKRNNRIRKNEFICAVKSALRVGKIKETISDEKTDIQKLSS